MTNLHSFFECYFIVSTYFSADSF